MISCCLALLVSAPMQLPTEAVTARIPVCQASAAVVRLGEAARVPMKTAADVATEIVYVNVKDRPLSETMANLADAVCGEWRKEEDGSYLLFRPDLLVRVEERKEITRKVKELKSCIADLQQGLKVPWNFNALRKLALERDELAEKYEQSYEEGGKELSEEEQKKNNERIAQIEGIDPVNRAVARALMDVNPEDIAKLVPQARIVYTLRPNRMQRQLGSNGAAALQHLQQEQILWGQVLKSLPQEPREEGEGSRFYIDDSLEFFKEHPEMQARTEPWQRTAPFVGSPTEVVLAISCTQYDYYQISLEMLASDGSEVMSCSSFTLEAWDMSEDTSEPKPGSHKIEYTAATKALAVLLGPPPSISDLESIPSTDRSQQIKILVPFVSDPAAHDPLKFANEEALDAWAESGALNIVACLSDESFFYGEVSDTVEAYESALFDCGMMSAITNNSMVLKPRSFATHWRGRFSRLALAEYSRDLLKTKKLEIDPYVWFAANSGQALYGSFVDRYVHLLLPDYGIPSNSVTLPNVRAFTDLYASLTDAMKAKLKQGVKIPYSTLNSRQQYFAALIVYGDAVSMGEEYPETGFTQQDPTYEMPFGLPRDGGITGSFVNDRIVVLHNPELTDGREFYTVRITEGSNQFFFGSRRAPQIPSAGIDSIRYDLREQTQVTLKLEMSPGHLRSGKFVGPLPAATGQPITLDKLPADAQKSLKSTLEMFKRMLDPDDGDYGDPPPPVQ